MKKIIIKIDLALIVILAIGCVLHFVNLGYSNYQGDEIKSLWMESDDPNWQQFLLSQTKGPLQFILNRLTREVNPGYENELITRLPYALMSVLAAVFLYLFVKSVFGKKTAFYAALLMTTNGIFVALGRISQYQGGSILFSILCLWLLRLAWTNPRFRGWGIFGGLVSWAIALLFHYDAVLIIPMVIFCLADWIIAGSGEKRIKVFMLGISGLVSLLVLLSFYFPFYYGLSQSTLNYWEIRFTGYQGLIYSSIETFKLYQPFLTLPLYLVCFVLGSFYLVKPYLQLRHFQERKPAFLSDPGFWLRASLLVWFGLAFGFMEILVEDPGTHIYTYLIPLSIIMGAGIAGLDDTLRALFPTSLSQKIAGATTKSLIGLGILFLLAQNWAIFIDHTPEYPWSEKQLFWLTLPRVERTGDLKLKIFGFPYQRGWAEVGSIVENHPAISCYGSNEKDPIVEFYTKIPPGDTCQGFYFYVIEPQSAEYTSSEKAEYWAQKYPPDFIVENENGVLINVYLIQTGTLQEIIKDGY